MQEDTRQEQIKSSQEDWHAHMKAWGQSGQSRASYCEQHGLKLSTFAYWRQRLKTDSTSVRLVQLPTRALRHTEGSTLRVMVDGRYTVEVLDGFNPATLGQVLEVLRGQ